jgi:hypothetical protein
MANKFHAILLSLQNDTNLIGAPDEQLGLSPMMRSYSRIYTVRNRTRRLLPFRRCCGGLLPLFPVATTVGDEPLDLDEGLFFRQVVGEAVDEFEALEPPPPPPPPAPPAALLRESTPLLLCSSDEECPFNNEVLVGVAPALFRRPIKRRLNMLDCPTDGPIQPVCATSLSPQPCTPNTNLHRQCSDVNVAFPDEKIPLGFAGA